MWRIIVSSPPLVVAKFRTMSSQPTHAEVRQITVDEESTGQRLDNFLIRMLKGVPKTHIYRVIRAGEVRVNKGRAQADTRLDEALQQLWSQARPGFPATALGL